MAPVTFTKATRKAAKLKIGIQGPSGSGKTDGALALAHQISPSGRIAVIDTENESASLYSDRYPFDGLNIEAPYHTAKYMAAIDAAVAGGYEVAVIDSISHQWAGAGGILARKDAMDARGGSGYNNWAKFTPEHEEFKAKLLHCPIHLIVTLRSKQDYVLESVNGKSVPKKVGMAPVQREGMEYELSLVFELQMDHKALVSKDRTGLFSGNATDPFDLRSPTVGAKLLEWLASGEQLPVVDPAEIEALITELLDTMTDDVWTEDERNSVDQFLKDTKVHDLAKLQRKLAGAVKMRDARRAALVPATTT
jgi:hypothetical protein